MVLTPSPIEGSAKRRIVILGSTGSIGANCLDVISCFEDRLQPVGLSAHKQWQTLFEQALNTQALRLAADPIDELGIEQLMEIHAPDLTAAARALGEEGPPPPRRRWSMRAPAA